LKGLKVVPSLQEIALAYDLLQYDPIKVTEQKLALWIQWARLDPRLAFILLQYLSKNWKKHNPMALHEALAHQPWPEALGPLLLFLLKEIPTIQERSRLKIWGTLVLKDFNKAPFESYFIGLRAFAGKLLQEDAEKSLSPYLRWGYFSQENLIQEKNKKKLEKKTLLKKAQRMHILNSLIQSHSRFTVKDYRRKLKGLVSVRQAELDLKNHSGLKKVGQTKGRTYSVIKNSMKK